MKAPLIWLLAAVAGCTTAAPRQLAIPSVVRMIDTGDGVASAVPITPTWLLTAKHAVPGVEAIAGSPVVRVIEHPLRDLALVQIRDPMPWRCAAIATELPRFGDHVTAIGWHLGEHLTVTDGRQSGTPYVISAPIVSGASGGAAVNDRGELFGILSAIGTLNLEYGRFVVFHQCHIVLVVDLRAWIQSNLKP